MLYIFLWQPIKRTCAPSMTTNKTYLFLNLQCCTFFCLLKQAASVAEQKNQQDYDVTQVSFTWCLGVGTVNMELPIPLTNVHLMWSVFPVLDYSPLSQEQTDMLFWLVTTPQASNHGSNIIQHKPRIDISWFVCYCLNQERVISWGITWCLVIFVMLGWAPVLHQHSNTHFRMAT